jgi:type IV pilus biogenesis protein CpaD/CtpE
MFKPQRSVTVLKVKIVGPHLLFISVLLALAGCAETDPYEREGVWRPNGANDANLRAMVANPADLARGVGDGRGNSQQAEAAIERLRADKVKALPASGIAQINVSGSSGGGGAGSGSAPASAGSSGGQ